MSVARHRRRKEVNDYNTSLVVVEDTTESIHENLGGPPRHRIGVEFDRMYNRLHPPQQHIQYPWFLALGPLDRGSIDFVQTVAQYGPMGTLAISKTPEVVAKDFSEVASDQNKCPPTASSHSPARNMTREAYHRLERLVHPTAILLAPVSRSRTLPASEQTCRDHR